MMKQQGHASEMSCIAYSSDGQYIVTGGEDSKVKLWNVSSGFCFVTFHEHTSAVTAVAFSNSKRCALSASLDGTVRAYDILRLDDRYTIYESKVVNVSSFYTGIVTSGHSRHRVWCNSVPLPLIIRANLS